MNEREYFDPSFPLVDALTIDDNIKKEYKKNRERLFNEAKDIAVKFFDELIELDPENKKIIENIDLDKFVFIALNTNIYE